jgi:hypothetical protein
VYCEEVGSLVGEFFSYSLNGEVFIILAIKQVCFEDVLDLTRTFTHAVGKVFLCLEDYEV